MCGYFERFLIKIEKAAKIVLQGRWIIKAEESWIVHHQAMYSGFEARPIQCPGDAGVHGMAMSNVETLSFRFLGFGLLGGDSANVTLRRSDRRGGGGGGGGGGVSNGGGGGVGREIAGESSWLLKPACVYCCEPDRPPHCQSRWPARSTEN